MSSVKGMDERFAQVSDDITLCYETFGDPADPTVLLIMGLGTQMVAWHEDFCRDLASRGFHVVRFDNRDIGRSTHLDHLPVPTIGQLLRRSKRAGYRLDDMAQDAVGLLDHLGVREAHVVGASMGGMIAQSLAARYPDRVLSLTSIMSNTGNRWSGQPALRLYPIFLRRPGRDREAFVTHTVRLFGLIGSPGFERDEDDMREMAGTSYDRGHDPAGSARQLAAVLASGDRTPALQSINAPTLVIHGDADKLVAPSGGRANVRAIPGARLLMIEGMGHDLPRGAWPRILDAIEEHARAAEGARARPEAA
jgi:pimeloyl-ACP methyl ester carboxylesterase